MVSEDATIIMQTMSLREGRRASEKPFPSGRLYQHRSSVQIRVIRNQRTSPISRKPRPILLQPTTWWSELLRSVNFLMLMVSVDLKNFPIFWLSVQWNYLAFLWCHAHTYYFAGKSGTIRIPVHAQTRNIGSCLVCISPNLKISGIFSHPSRNFFFKESITLM